MTNILWVQQPGLNVITELIIGYLYPGKPLANVAFKTYGSIGTSQAIMFLSDFKLGHYMKIPPKSMFIVQVRFLQNGNYSIEHYVVLFACPRVIFSNLII